MRQTRDYQEAATPVMLSRFWELTTRVCPLQAAIGNLRWTCMPISTLWEDPDAVSARLLIWEGAGDGTRPCTKDASALSTRLHACCGTSCLLPQDPREKHLC